MRKKKQTESNVFSKKNKRKIAVLFVQIDDSGNTEENYPSFRSYKGTQTVKDGLRR